MAAQEHNDYGNRVWAGDPTTIAKARTKYRDDPEGQLIPFAVALYSFRANGKFAQELLRLREPLIMRVKQLEAGPSEGKPTFDDGKANQADVLSTYLEWMSRRRELSAKQQKETTDAAGAIYRWGIRFADPRSETGGHTWSLLRLTLARLDMRHKYWGRREALRVLKGVARAAPHIKDANQRVRAYRKLGMLYRLLFHPVAGLYWGIRACLIPGVPTAVRMKSLAAFIIDN